ncbi:hypothetical protein ABE38_06030 [Brevibacillus agri]|nr:hypothetical protein [Brevibacillus agri]
MLHDQSTFLQFFVPPLLLPVFLYNYIYPMRGTERFSFEKSAFFRVAKKKEEALYYVQMIKFINGVWL